MTLLWILLSLAAIMFLSVVVVVVIVWAVVHRIRRSRHVRDAVLRTRTTFSWGSRRRVLALRLQLAQIVDSGRAALTIAAQQNGRRGELPRLFRRIEVEAMSLDSQLLLMESETDSAVLARELPEATARVQQLGGMVGRVRASVASGLASPDTYDLASLTTEVDREVIALRAGVDELRRLTAHDAPPIPLRQAS